MNTNDKQGQLVSIIIPSYNAAAYVKYAVDSALAQTYKNCEVIVVDDGSTDNTRQVLAPYIDSGKIKYIYHENKGLAGARNTGIKNSSGEYIALLDADDIFLPEKIAEQVRVLEENTDFGVCYSDLIHFSDSEPRKFYHHRYKYPSGNIFEPLLHKQFINPLTVMARREVFEQCGYFNESLRRSEDWDLWLRWAHAGVKFYYLDKPLAYYRVRSIGNLSSLESEPAMKEKNLEIFTNLGESLDEAERKKYEFDRILKKLRLKAAAAYLMVGDKKSALNFLREWPLMRFAVRIMPAGLLKFALGAARQLKHRLLLKKL
jgi:glycosyltransferase involved in cell wall biosynthesis